MTDPTHHRGPAREAADTARAATGAGTATWTRTREAGATGARTGGAAVPGAHAPAGGGRKRPWWLLALAALLALALLIFGLSRCGADRDRVDAPGAGAPGASAVPAPGAPDGGTPGGPDASVPGAAGAAGAAAGALTAGGASLFSAARGENGGLAALVGQQATGTAVPVQSVPADEGFWVGTGEADRVWVKLVPGGESPVQVREGQLLELSGPLVAHDGGFADREGVSAAEGAEQLTREAAHVEADQDQVRVVGSR